MQEYDPERSGCMPETVSECHVTRKYVMLFRFLTSRSHAEPSPHVPPSPQRRADQQRRPPSNVDTIHLTLNGRLVQTCPKMSGLYCNMIYCDILQYICMHISFGQYCTFLRK